MTITQTLLLSPIWIHISPGVIEPIILNKDEKIFVIIKTDLKFCFTEQMNCRKTFIFFPQVAG
jgi:hypothetical protein